jgi:hypothetical protein
MFARQGQLIFTSQNSVLAASVGGLFLVGDDFQPTIDRQLKLFSGLVLSWVLAGFDP